jgi:hypothetical protein
VKTRVVIVGPEEATWPKELKPAAIKIIDQILLGGVWTCPLGHEFHAMKGEKPVCPHCGSKDGNTRTGEVTLVTGRCPYGGIDVWAEQRADLHRIAKDIKEPDVRQWPSMWKCRKCDFAHLSKGYTFSHQACQHGIECEPLQLKGYMARNLEMAFICELVCYCIVPAIANAYCDHHHKYGHPKNGGCWTLERAGHMHKITRLILVREDETLCQNQKTL